MVESTKLDATSSDLTWNLAIIIVWASAEVNLITVSGRSARSHDSEKQHTNAKTKHVFQLYDLLSPTCGLVAVTKPAWDRGPMPMAKASRKSRSIFQLCERPQVRRVGNLAPPISWPILLGAAIL